MKTRFRISAVVGSGILCIALTACAGLSDSAWEARRTAAVNRPRTLVYNTDGNDAHNWPSNLPVTVENFTGRRLVHALGTRITTVSYCPLSSGFGRLTCRKAGEAYCVSSHRGKRHVSADLFVMGTDPLELPIRAYNFSKSQPSCEQLAKWAGVTSQEAIRRLLDIAARCGAAGIVMECVDPGNYPLADCKVIRDFEL